MNKEKIISVATIVVVVLLIIFALNWKIPQKPDDDIKTPTQTFIPTPTTTSELPSISPIVKNGAVWLGNPQLISPNPDIINNLPKEAKFYLLGTIEGDQIIITSNWDCFPGGCNSYFFRKHGSTYTFLEGASGKLDNLNNATLKPEVLIDRETTFAGLSGPNEIFYGDTLKGDGRGQLLEDSYLWGRFDSFEKAVTVDAGDLYLGKTRYLTPENDIKYLHIYLKLKSGLFAEYFAQPFFVNDDGTIKVSFVDNYTTNDSYNNGRIGGCGGDGPVVINNISSKRIRKTGEAMNQAAIYEFAQIDDPVFTEFFNIFDGEYYDYNRETETSTLHTITKQQYFDLHAILLYQDVFGNWRLLRDSVYGPQAECGKPVIYLYPEKPTRVSVKVGAKITKSEPEYGTGWEILAMPDGTIDGKYPNLFWEGLGNGIYPEITEGFVVKSENLEQTLRDHLAQLGLNARETQDFLDFWLEKMPTTPYTRLTWFGTGQMNALAPLDITPKPDTVIRVFLDFAGLEKPIDIKPQKLSAIARQGFTVIEWGGLLWKQ